jgi:hypothetical protein
MRFDLEIRIAQRCGRECVKCRLAAALLFDSGAGRIALWGRLVGSCEIVV